MAGDWVRAALVAIWAASGLRLAVRGARRGSARSPPWPPSVGGICAATASSSRPGADPRRRGSARARGRPPCRARHPERRLPAPRPPRPGAHHLRSGPRRRRAAGRRGPRAGCRPSSRRGVRRAAGGAPHRPPGVPRLRGRGPPTPPAGRLRHRRHRGGRLGDGRPAPAGRLAHPRRCGRGRRRPRSIPLALAAGTSPKISRSVDRVLVHTVSATGLTAVVVAVYLVIVIGLGRAPADDERTLLVLSMLAAAVAALAYVPARERLAETRQPARLRRAPPARRGAAHLGQPPQPRPSRWTSCCCSWPSRCARCSRCAGRDLDRHRGRLELAVVGARPVRRRRSLLGGRGAAGGRPGGRVGQRLARGVAARPARGSQAHAQLRVAPAAHSGELLGLLVVERAADGDAVHRGGRPRPHRAGPPGGPRPPQRAARLRPAGEPREPRAGQRGPRRPRALASWPPATPSGARSSATCTTAPSSTSSRWR